MAPITPVLHCSNSPWPRPGFHMAPVIILMSRPWPRPGFFPLDIVQLLSRQGGQGRPIGAKPLVQKLSPCHCRTALGAFLLKARVSLPMGHSFTAVWADTVSTRTAATATAATAATAALSHASTCSRALAPWACSISSWHCRLL